MKANVHRFLGQYPLSRPTPHPTVSTIVRAARDGGWWTSPLGLAFQVADSRNILGESLGNLK